MADARFLRQDEWAGINDNLTDIAPPNETTAYLIKNASLLIRGECGRRYGLGALIPGHYRVAPLVVAELAGYIIYIDADGNVYSYTQSGSNIFTILTTGYNVGQYSGPIPCMAQMLQRMYMCNDWQLMQCSDDGVTIRTAGIVEPAQNAPTVYQLLGGTWSVGTHLIRWRYYDSVRQRYSNPTDATQFTIVEGYQTVQINVVASTDTTVTNILVEATAAEGSQFYQIFSAPNTTNGNLELAYSDFTIENYSINVETYGDFQHLPPPLSTLLVEHRQRGFTWGTATQVVPGTVTNGSPTVNMSLPISPNWAGREMIGLDGATYQIQSTTTSTITLETNYAGTSGSGNLTIKFGFDDLLCWSRAGLPESWDPVSYARRITLDTGDTPAAMVSYYTDLYLFGMRSARRLVFNADPATGMVVNVPGTLGCFNQRCVVSAPNGVLFGWGRDGMWMISALMPQKISQPVEQTLNQLADPAQITNRFVVYEPLQRIVMFFFARPSKTGCTDALVYHTDQAVWTRSTFKNPMSAGCPNSEYLDNQYLMLADINGYSWRVGAGTTTNDGDGSGIVTVTGYTSPNIIAGTNSAQVGQYLYRPYDSTSYLIHAATSSQITISGSFASAVQSGELLYVGSIDQNILSQWYIGEGLQNKSREAWLDVMVRQIKTNAGKMGTMTLQFYVDFEDSTPVAIPPPEPTATWPPGMSLLNSNTIQIDCDNSNQNGFFSIPVPIQFQRAVKVQIDANQPYNGIRFYDFQFRIMSRSQSAPTRNA